MRLFTIGDSLAQGFMSGAAARSDLCFSTHVAKQLGIPDYKYPHWPQGGLPINIENVLRRLNRVYGSDISGIEWLFVAGTVNAVVDRSEDYYERGDGSADTPYRSPIGLGAEAPDFFHNIAVWAFDIADAWQITPNLCREMIDDAEDVWFDDGILSGPSGSFYRTALQVLNPSRKAEFNDYTQLHWLEHHVKQEGVENLILWLGNNSVLGTALDLQIRMTPNDPNARPGTLSHGQRTRRNWNIWHPEDFRHDYEALISRVIGIMGGNQDPWRVFIGNIPHVTIPPLIKGLEPTIQEGNRTYYTAYTYFPFGKEFAHKTRRYLTGKQAMFIDRRIDDYNAVISQIIRDANQQLSGDPETGPFHIIDFNTMMQSIAFKRNAGNPQYVFPAFFAGKKKLTTHYYHVDRQGELIEGGLFSLDGVHPSIIGQGLIADEMLKAMAVAGVTDDSGNPVDATKLNWQEIWSKDELVRRPISLMSELYEHERLAAIVVKSLNFLGLRSLNRSDV